jgi:hypothetical protein
MQRPQPRSTRALPLLLAIALIALLLSACTAAGPLQITGGTPSPEQTYGGAIESVLGFQMPAVVVPTATPEPEEQLQVIVDTAGSRANIRSGPGLDAAIIDKGDPGTAYNVIGKSQDGAWWQISVGGTEGWVADSVVRLAGEGEAVAVTSDVSNEPVVNSDYTASWDIDWSCESTEGRCSVNECTATVNAAVNRGSDGAFLPVEYEVQWSDECFNTDSWVFEVDPFTGRESTGEYADNFLYAYWAGANAGAISGVLPFGEDQGIVVSCQGPDTVEIEEGDGWTSVYEGVTCHDRNTGMLAYMNYIKRWLFTGDYEGQSYERAFFGDVERLEQRLTNTNADLLLVDRR